MGTGYTRQSAANIITDNVIEAADLNAEFNLLESAFNSSTGHSHDGTSGEGPQIALTSGISGVLPIANGGTNAATASAAATSLGVGTSDSPQFAGINLGHASDTTLTRVSAGVIAVEGTNVLLNGGALGTPSSATLTNATGLPVAGITSSTSTALGVGSLELGHASDTTIARVSAGLISVEGANVPLESRANTFTAAQTMSLTTAGTPLSLVSTDAGAAEGPILDIYRDSATPAASDVIGSVQYTGKDNAGNKTTYALTRAVITDTTDASEDGDFVIQTMRAGTLTEAARVSSVGALSTTTIELGHASDTTLSRSAAGQLAIEGGAGSIYTGTIELGAASDTTLARSAAGVVSVEGGAGGLYVSSIELGAASDTTITRSTAGVLAVEGGVIPKENRANTFSAGQSISVTSGDTLTMTSTSAGNSGVTFFPWHNSASPASNDILFGVTVGGNSNTAAYVNYGQLQCVISDATNASEDSHWVMKSILAGVEFTSGFFAFGDGFGTSTDKSPYNNSGNSPGIWASASGADFSVARYQATPAAINRTGDDGILLDFLKDGASQGYIAVAVGTVSLTGAHLSRETQWSSPIATPVVGTVLSNENEMCVFKKVSFEVEVPNEPGKTITKNALYSGPENEGDIVTYNYNGQDVSATVHLQPNPQLNKMSISSIVGDKNVAGVFQGNDEDGDPLVAQSGDFVIRIGAGIVVQRGDLLESNGDGTARPQVDDFVKSCTIAKVSSTTVTQTYADGSYLVPCVLMAGG